MTYINALEERKVFDVVRYQLTSRGFSFRQLFIFTGIITFFLSPIADNLTTALVMCSVVMACGKGNTKFISIGCINIVVAANAGGAFSPFGDITTLMVWQAGIVEFFTFFKIFFPSVVNYIIPAAVMYFFIPNEKPQISSDREYMKRGGRVIIFLGLLTIFSAVNFHNILHLPPMLGMMFGAIVDNIPVMFAVITMRPEMSIDQWLLVTLTTGVGGSLLSIGSAAGVALMGQARGYYTFFGHLKWTPVIFIGYVASIYLHVLMADLPW